MKKHLVYFISRVSSTYTLTTMIAVAIFAVTLSSCQKEDSFEPDVEVTSEALVSDLNMLRVEFAKALSVAINENAPLRNLIKSEALRKFDKDYDVLYQMVKDKPLSNEHTVRDVISRYISEDNLSAIENKLPLLTIFVPNLPNFSADSWNTDNQIPEVALLLEGENNVKFFNGTGSERSIEPHLIPAFPVVVLKTNERVILANNKSIKNGKTLSPSFYQSDKLAFSFIDESFDGTNGESDANKRWLSSRGIDERVKTAYELDLNWQRDYIYYGLTPTTDKGPLLRNYSESIASFKFNDNIDAITAYNKISDQTGDAKYSNYNYNKSGPFGSDIEPALSTWLEGSFEFKVTILINAKNGIGPTIVKSFPVEGDELFNVIYKKGSGALANFLVVDKVTKKTHYPHIEILPWDLQNYGIAWKFFIQEWDPDQTIERVEEFTSTYATNFSLNPTFGIFEKAGLNFGASGTFAERESHTITTTLSSDDLGETVLTFDQPVITSDFRIFGSQLYSTREIKTGWITLSVEPRRIY